MKVTRSVFILINLLTWITPVWAQWSEPINMGPPVNSGTQELRPSLTSFSDMIVIKTGRGNLSGLFTSSYFGGEWSELDYISSVGNPANIEPALSPDGKEIYFSCYCGGYGDYDIWKTVYDTISAEWSAPMNVGPNVNDWGGQTAPFLSYDGQKLFFIDHSMRFSPGIVFSYRIGNEWGYPERLDSYFRHAENVSLTLDENTLFFGKAVPDEHWAVFFSQKDVNGNWNEPQPFNEINEYGTALYPRVSADGLRVYFESGDMGGEGGSDIWYVESLTETDNTEHVAQSNLLEIYPNPFNNSTTIKFQIDSRSDVAFDIFNILGQLVYADEPREYDAGIYSKDLDLGAFPSGIYILGMTTKAGYSNNISITLLK